ncbi:MAG: pyridoxal 5'-phosphate synthase glutaminase subunit PdxT [Dehalococcoidia bacterium]
MKIGVLALQGAFIEHVKMFEKVGHKAVEVRLPRQLHDIQGLLIPGGESTTMMNLMQSFDFIKPIKKLAEDHVAIWGTCAGLICVAKKVRNPDSTYMETLGLMNITVMRNAFGRQVDSFETGLQITGLSGGPFPGVFIRAPYIEKVGRGVEVLARLSNGEIVAARQGKMLATSFHPELTEDTRFHGYFLEICRS